MLHERVAQLEAQVVRLGDAFDQNTDVFTESFKMTEAMQCVFQRVMNDFVQHGTFVYEKYGLPDWGEYMRYFWLCQTMADFAHWLGGLQEKKQEVPEQGTLITRPDDDARVVETHIFGG